MPFSWERIPEDVPYLERERSIKFAVGNYSYSLRLVPSSPTKIQFEANERTENWIVETVKRSRNRLSLRGFAFDVPGIKQKECWYELELGSVSKITFWGDRVILRIDETINADIESQD